MGKKIDLYILTGFLGSGKTTMLLNLIDKMKGEKIGIIQNEFGKLSIDGEILKSGDIEMKEISRGSIFCSCLKLNFVQALAEMADMDIEYLFVESSGLADPSNMEEILKAVEAVRSVERCNMSCGWSRFSEFEREGRPGDHKAPGGTLSCGSDK